MMKGMSLSLYSPNVLGVCLAFSFLVSIITAQSAPSQLVYQVGQEFQYQVTGNVDARGSQSDTQQRTNGSMSTMNSILMTKCVEVHPDHYIFVMNMFNTVVNVGQGSLDMAKTTGDAPLGADVYYQQQLTGEIPQIWYQKGDSSYYVNVKLGAINAFQTHVLPVGQKKTIQESDPVGQHLSDFEGAHGDSTGSLKISKGFDQADFQSFPDSGLHKNNVMLSAATSTQVHPQGYITQSTVDQLVSIVDVTPFTSSSLHRGMPASSSRRSGNLGDSDTGLNVDLSSQGHLTIALTQLRSSPEDSVFPAPLSKAQLHSGISSYIETDMFNLSKYLCSQALEMEFMDIGASLETLLELSHQKSALLMHKIEKYMSVAGTEADLASFESLAKKLPSLNAVSRSRVLSLLATLPTQDLLIRYGISGADSTVAISAVFASLNTGNPSELLMSTLEALAFDVAETGDVQEAATLAYGSALARSVVPASPRFLDALRNLNKVTEDRAVTLIHAVGNAGPQGIPLDSFPATALRHSSAFLRAAAVHALRKYVSIPAASGLLLRTAKYDQDYLVMRAASQVAAQSGLSLPLVFDGDDYPFNKSYSKDLKLGGSTVNANFSAELFAGTNFNCKETSFNYEGLAQGSVGINLFGYSKQAAIAEAIYGRDNGAVVGDKIYLKVWDDVIYDKQIPSVDCTEHTYPLAHGQKGLDVSYTLWVSIIPITFSAGAQLTMDLSWGWSVCDSDLSVMVELIPKATLTVYGEAEIDLLIIKAGIELSGSFNTQLSPQGYIHGSQCQVGFDLKQVSDPMTIDFDGYYAWKSCKYLIFDCHWRDHHQQTFYSWTAPAIDRTIFDQAWAIKA